MAARYTRNGYLICAIMNSDLSNNNNEHGGWKHDFTKSKQSGGHKLELTKWKTEA